MRNPTKKGGYKIISLGGYDIHNISGDVVIKGIHNAIETTYGKPILLTGIVVDGVEKNDLWVVPSVEDGNYVINKVYGNKVIIYPDDSIDVVGYKKSIAITKEEITLESIEDGDTIKLTNNYESDTTVNLPSNLLYIASDNLWDGALAGGSINKGEDTYITITSSLSYDVYLKRIGDVVFITSSLEL